MHRVREELKKLLREQGEEEGYEPSNVQSKLYHKFPRLMELLLEEGLHGFFQKYLEWAGLKKAKDDTNTKINFNKLKEYKKRIPKFIKGEEQPTELDLKTMQRLEDMLAEYKGDTQSLSAEESKDRLKKEFPYIDNLFRKQLQYREDKRIWNEKLAGTKGEGFAFTIDKALRIYKIGLQNGYDQLTDGQLRTLSELEDKIKRIINGEEDLLTIEYLGKGSRRILGDIGIQPKNEQRREDKYNTLKALEKALPKVLNIYWRRNDGVPEVHKKDFELFFQYFMRIAEKNGYEIFNYLRNYYFDMAKNVMRKYWDEMIK